MSPDLSEKAVGLVAKVDVDRCMGSGNCMFWAPESFEFSDEGHADVTDTEASTLEQLRVAVEGCPVGAISLWRGDTEVKLTEEG